MTDLGQVIKRVFFSFSWFLKSWNISMKNCYISRPKFLCHGFICLKRIKYLSRLVWSSDWCNFLWLKNLLYWIFFYKIRASWETTASPTLIDLSMHCMFIKKSHANLRITLNENIIQQCTIINKVTSTILVQNN